MAIYGPRKRASRTTGKTATDPLPRTRKSGNGSKKKWGPSRTQLLNLLQSEFKAGSSE